MDADANVGSVLPELLSFLIYGISFGPEKPDLAEGYFAIPFAVLQVHGNIAPRGLGQAQLPLVGMDDFATQNRASSEICSQEASPTRRWILHGRKKSKLQAITDETQQSFARRWSHYPRV